MPVKVVGKSQAAAVAPTVDPLEKVYLLENGILVRPREAEEFSSGTHGARIALPDNAKEKPAIGVVLKVGPGRTFDNGTTKPMTVKVGDTVQYGKYGGHEVKVQGTTYTIITESDVLLGQNP
jgi:chaperonin GroES